MSRVVFQCLRLIESRMRPVMHQGRDCSRIKPEPEALTRPHASRQKRIDDSDVRPGRGCRAVRGQPDVLSWLQGDARLYRHNGDVDGIARRIALDQFAEQF